MKVIKEHVTHPDRSLRFLHLELDAFAQPRHAHRHVELTWIEQGHGLRLVGDNASAFGAGDLVLLAPNVAHAWLTGSQRQYPRPAASVVQFAPEWLTQSPYPELRNATALLHAAERGLLWRGPTARAVTALLVQMRGADAYAQLAALVRIVGLLATARPRDRQPIAAARLCAADKTPADQHPQPRRVDRVIDWMQRHLSQELRLEDAAMLAHVTPAAFSRWFKREVGKTFTQYLNDLRYGAACLALARSNQPVARVAAECGYSTMSHFNRQFKLRCGVAPRVYRQRA